MNQGWSCPKCGAVWSPTVRSCERCNGNGGAKVPTPDVPSPPPHSGWEWVPVEPTVTYGDAVVSGGYVYRCPPIDWHGTRNDP